MPKYIVISWDRDGQRSQWNQVIATSKQNAGIMVSQRFHELEVVDVLTPNVVAGVVNRLVSTPEELIEAEWLEGADLLSNEQGKGHIQIPSEDQPQSASH
jgi:hypothetical protein